MSLASPPGRLRCTGRRRRPIRIGSWAFTRTWVGVERWCPQQRPQGGKRRQKAASPLPASQGGQGFPRTPICSTRTHRRWIRKIQTEPGTGKGCMEGKGAIPPDLARLRLAVLTAEPSGTPHATPAGAAALDPMASAKKRPRPRRHPGTRAGFPGVRLRWRRGGGGGGERRWGKTLDSPVSP